MAISMLKIRQPLGRLIFNMGIAIPGKTVFLIETAPRIPDNSYDLNAISLIQQYMNHSASLSYSAQSISGMLMTWQRKEPGHQQPWFDSIILEYFCFSTKRFKEECSTEHRS